MVDHRLVQRKLLQLHERISQLQSFRLRTYREFKKIPYPKAVEKLLQELIEICIDIGKHILADEQWGVANEAREIFSILQQKKVLSAAQCRQLQQMAGFRNLLVHLYEKIDEEIVFGIYRKRLGDFTKFSQTIEKFLRRKS